MKLIKKIKNQLTATTNIEDIRNGFKLSLLCKKLTQISFEIEVTKIIFPLREGEIIKNIEKLPIDKEYSLSYPGTASTKSMVLFSENKKGIFVGGEPSYEFTKIKIRRKKGKKLIISYNSNNHKLYFIHFKHNWKIAANQYKKIIGLEENKKIKRKPKYFLQIGIKNSSCECGIKNFLDLKNLIDYFHSKAGSGHIIHFFGTNKNGFDRMLPDYSIDPKLGGKKSFKNLITYIKKKGLLTSHHYNPRIADKNWIEKNIAYTPAILKYKSGNPIIELYKGHRNYVMNPNNESWFNKCMKNVKYLKSIGFDYIQLDQFAYQRNFYNKEKPIQLGYKKMIEEFDKLKIKTWLEGVSDIFKLKKDNFYQILNRDNAQVWDDHESRRGYPYGKSCPDFFIHLFPNAEISYQLITEKIIYHILRKN